MHALKQRVWHVVDDLIKDVEQKLEEKENEGTDKFRVDTRILQWGRWSNAASIRSARPITME